MRKGARWCGLIYGGATWENSGGIRLGDVIGEVPAASSRLSTPENELIRLGLTWAHLEHSSQLPKPATAWSAPLAHLTACCTSWLLILKRGALIAFCRRGEVPLVLVLGEMPLGMTSLRPCSTPLSTPGRPLPCPCRPLGQALSGRSSTPKNAVSNPTLGTWAVVPVLGSLAPLPTFWPCVAVAVRRVEPQRWLYDTMLVVFTAVGSRLDKAGNSLDDVPASRVTEFDKAAELERRLLSSCSRSSWIHTVGPCMAESHQQLSVGS